MADENVDSTQPAQIRSRRSSIYSAPVRNSKKKGGGSRRGSRGDVVAIEDNGDANGALRKNKAFQQLRREMEQRNRQRRKMDIEVKVEVFYVDRDRAAAVVLGNKDIKNELQVKKKRDRLENSSTAAVLTEDVEIETYLLQGEHELKSGDPRRAAMYLTSACDMVNEHNPVPFVLRSKCYTKLGLYDLADDDADAVLTINPFGVKGLLIKAESQYNMGRFEHAMKYFFRANTLRPDTEAVASGIRKSQDAIENALCRSKAFHFDDLPEVIEALNQKTMKQDQLENQSRLFQQELVQEEKEAPEELESDLEDEIHTQQRKERYETKLHAVLMGSVPELEGVWESPKVTPSSSFDGIASLSSTKMESKEQQEEKRFRRKENVMRKNNKELLGELNKDFLYLEKLLANPVMNSFNTKNETETYISHRVQACAREGLIYLGARKDFWQQQRPVYARRKDEVLAKSYSNFGLLRNGTVRPYTLK